MIFDELAEFNGAWSLGAGDQASDTIDTGTIGVQSGYDIDLVLTVMVKTGTVAAKLQESNDGATWNDLLIHSNLPIGRSGGRFPPFSKRYLRVLWTVTGTATVAAGLTQAATSEH